MADPTDYVLAGVLFALHSLNPNQRANHSITTANLQQVFKEHYSIQLNEAEVYHVTKKMETLGILTTIVDPYAETLLETSDAKIADFISETQNDILIRGWTNENWLKSAYENEKLWQDIDEIIAGAESIGSVPSADGFVTVNHNSAAYIEAETSIVAADEALRGDNEFEDIEQRGWIRTHVETGLSLLKRGGPVLRAAVISLIVEPLKAALKATTNEKVKQLVGLALTALLKWLGL